MMNKRKNSTRKDRLKKQSADNYNKWLKAQRDNLLEHAKTSDNPEYYQQKADRFDRLLAKSKR